MTGYLDTSIVLRLLLGERGAFRKWTRWSEAYSSELLKVESRRVIDRLRLEAFYGDEEVARAHELVAHIEASISFVRVTPQVLERAAAPMPTVVKTLDAVHLASAQLLREQRDESIVFASHDEQQSRAARALGFRRVG